MKLQPQEMGEEGMWTFMLAPPTVMLSMAVFSLVCQSFQHKQQTPFSLSDAYQPRPEVLTISLTKTSFFSLCAKIWGLQALPQVQFPSFL